MAILNNQISFSQVFLISAILILGSINGQANASGLKHSSHFCAQTNPGEERALCNLLVTGARTWDEAISRVIHAALDQVKPLKPLIEGLGGTLPGSLRPISKDSILQTCTESYASILDELNGALDCIRTGDKFGALNTQLSAAFTSLSDCTDGLGEFGIDGGQLTRFQGILEKYTSVSLAVSSIKHHLPPSRKLL